jgi:hypothetical protein
MYDNVPLACRVFGHRYRFAADGATMRWTCERCGTLGGEKAYESPGDAERFARAFDREDRDDLGRRAPLIAGLGSACFACSAGADRIDGWTRRRSASRSSSSRRATTACRSRRSAGR